MIELRRTYAPTPRRCRSDADRALRYLCGCGWEVRQVEAGPGSPPTRYDLWLADSRLSRLWVAEDGTILP